MGNASLKQHYETASKTGVLQISNQKLKEIPPQVIKLQEHLRNLDFSHNKLQALPEDVCRFKLMKQLNVESNQLVALPKSLGDIGKLEILNASNNHLQSLPPTLSDLRNIKQLYLNYNNIAEFPVQVFGLKHLDVLELSNNKIITVPVGFEGLFVTELNLNQNQISTLSDDLHKAPKLKILRLEENCLPLDAISPALLRDSKIHTLILDGNLFEIKQLASVEGYNEFMERYTAVKKKMF